jgi:hypothetical protein
LGDTTSIEMILIAHMEKGKLGSNFRQGIDDIFNKK